MNYKLIDSSLLDELTATIRELKKQVKELTSTKPKTIYNNLFIMPYYNYYLIN